MKKHYDYVIVGAGSAGCTLAARLTEDAYTSVLLLEAGGWDRDPWIRIPLGWGKIFGERRHDWMYFTEPEPELNNRAIECARGKIIGGSSSINAMAYVRGHRGDYDRWASAGLTRWAYDRVLPYFKKQESWSGGASPYRGTSGPLQTSPSAYVDPLASAYLEAAEAAGYAINEDYNGAQQEGFSRLQSTIGRGLRCSAANAYLHPNLRRPNLTVKTGAQVMRVNLDNNRATGVTYRHMGETVTAMIGREVLLAGGVINSPQVLMLSGIGDPEELRAHDVDVAVPLRGVGKNLRDHLSVAVEYNRNGRGPFQRAMRLDRIAIELAKAVSIGKGVATDLPSGWTAFVKAVDDSPLPDTQLIFRAGPLTAYPYMPPFRKGFRDGFACRAVMLRPESTGTVTLSSNNPFASPSIRQSPLRSERDRKTMRNGLRLAHALGQQRAVAPFIESECGPNYATISDSDLDAHIRAMSQTAHHPLGTCRMGHRPDNGDVVDDELKVHGVEGLRVVDASVMPDAVGGNINGPVIMIAEVASDIIRGHAPLASMSLN